MVNLRVLITKKQKQGIMYERTLKTCVYFLVVGFVVYCSAINKKTAQIKQLICYTLIFGKTTKSKNKQNILFSTFTTTQRHTCHLIYSSFILNQVLTFRFSVIHISGQL